MTPHIRDIRADLKARLDLINVRRQKAQERYEAELGEIKRDETMLEALLEAEDRFMASARVGRSWAGSPLENEILDLVSNEGDWDHSEIKQALLDRGHGKGDQGHFGQSLHGMLLSMSRRDRPLLTSAGHGKWKITQFGLTGEEQE